MVSVRTALIICLSAANSIELGVSTEHDPKRANTTKEFCKKSARLRCEISVQNNHAPGTSGKVRLLFRAGVVSVTLSSSLDLRAKPRIAGHGNYLQIQQATTPLALGIGAPLHDPTSAILREAIDRQWPNRRPYALHIDPICESCGLLPGLGCETSGTRAT